MTRQQKITPGETRASGPCPLVVFCGDDKCAHSVVIDADRWPDHFRLSDLEPSFVCTNHRGADARPQFELARMVTDA
jgi:hypothetical protein